MPFPICFAFAFDRWLFRPAEDSITAGGACPSVGCPSDGDTTGRIVGGRQTLKSSFDLKIAPISATLLAELEREADGFARASASFTYPPPRPAIPPLPPPEPAPQTLRSGRDCYFCGRRGAVENAHGLPLCPRCTQRGGAK